MDYLREYISEVENHICSTSNDLFQEIVVHEENRSVAERRSSSRTKSDSGTEPNIRTFHH